MPLFSCSKCNCVEDTALCHFWSARLRHWPPQCSACDPTVGKWHGEFPRESAQGWISDRNGFLLDKRSVERWLGQSIEIISKPEPETSDSNETMRPEGSESVRVNVLALDAVLSDIIAP